MTRPSGPAIGQRDGAREERRGGVRGLAGLLLPLLSPAARRRGFAETTILTDWPRVVGAGFAARCQPVRLDRPRGGRGGGTLLLRATGGAALELQHAAPQLLERINGHFGYPAVARLRFLHAPPVRRRPAPAPPPPRSPSPAAREAVAALTSGIPDPGLREALRALGEAVAAAEGPGSDR